MWFHLCLSYAPFNPQEEEDDARSNDSSLAVQAGAAPAHLTAGPPTGASLFSLTGSFKAAPVDAARAAAAVSGAGASRISLGAASGAPAPALPGSSAAAAAPPDADGDEDGDDGVSGGNTDTRAELNRRSRGGFLAAGGGAASTGGAGSGDDSDDGDEDIVEVEASGADGDDDAVAAAGVDGVAGHASKCFVCKKEAAPVVGTRELLLCGRCPKAFHMPCLGLSKPPAQKPW